LTDLELLHALIGSGNAQRSAREISRDILKVLQSKGANVEYSDIECINGMGNAKTTEVIAAFELAKRYLIESEKPIVGNPEKVYELLHDIRNLKQEHFILLTLDGANRLIDRHTISIGTVGQTIVHPRDVFQKAIEDNATSIIVAHNHPSGTLEPSKQDIQITKQLNEASEIMDIKLLDHIIITKTEFRSVING
jgi:DNA repair protein RadC